MGKKQVGILGGTFDPVHTGHLAIAKSAKKEAGLDLILFMVAGDPWQKAGEDVSPAEDRLLMVEAAVSNMPGFEASNLEIARGGASYMVDTLAELKPMNAELFLILGSDVAVELETWERPQALKRLCGLIVVRRPGFEGADLSELTKRGWQNVLEIEGPMLDISGTEIRKKLNEGLPVGDVLPDSVLEVIAERNIYGKRAKVR